MEVFVVVLISFLLGAGAATLLGSRRLRQERHDRELLEQSFRLQQQELEEQSRQQEQWRRLRHDLRHHMTALQGLVTGGNWAAAQAYLEAFGDLQPAAPRRLCENVVADALIRRYLARAEEDRIAVDAVLEIGEAPGIRGPDLCVVLGNCLENAMEAIRRTEGEERFIRLRAKETPGWLSIVMENSCGSVRLEQHQEGYASGKEPDRIGIGLMSIRAVTEKYGGVAEYKAEGGRFWTAVILLKEDGER